jgi:hypothetical protein
MVACVFFALVAAQPVDGGAPYRLTDLLGKGPAKRVFVGTSLFGPALRGHAADLERQRLETLGAQTRCDDRACFEKAFARCSPARFVVPVLQGICGLEEKRSSAGTPPSAWGAAAGW